MAFVEEVEDEEEEEEEEEDHVVGQRPPPPPAPPQRQDTQEEDNDFEPPEMEDVAFAAAGLLQGAWERANQLRQRRGVEERAPPRTAGGIFTEFEDFNLNLKEDHGPGKESQIVSLWRQAVLSMFILAGVVASAARRRPDEASFVALRDLNYGEAPTQELVPANLAWLVQADRSFEGHVAWSRYVDHGPIALATVALSVGGQHAAGSKQKNAQRKVYEHRYVGILGQWLPLPYLPQPGQKPGTYGVGLCVLARCVCVPNPRGSAGKTTNTTGSGCLRFQGDKSAVLNVMAIPNMVLFGLWQFPSYWGAISKHASLSLANLCCGRVWVLLAAPFSHRNWGEIFGSAVLMATAVDSFDRAGVSFMVLLALYLGGCWAAWLARCVLWRRLWNNDSYAYYAEEWGASGGLAAQLLFLARARPQERFQFSLYLMPTPIELSAWQSLFAHALMDVIVLRKGEGLVRESLAHLAAWGVGWAVYDAWARHL